MRSPELGDYIGGESCVDMKPYITDIPSRSAGMNRRRWRYAAEKEYPPPIQFPTWVMKKYYTSGGRLVIKEEKLKPHQYFQAHRSNGRLLLNLVPLDDAVDNLNCPEFMEISNGEEINGRDDEVNIDPTVEQVLFHDECYRFNNEVGVNPCGGFGVPVSVASFRPPVHT